MSDGDAALVSPADEALFRPVRTGNAFEETVERLLQLIRLGVVRPGERLPSERELAARFQVSRMTVHDAIRALQDAEYVESRRGRYGGTFVRTQLPRVGRTAAKKLAREMGAELEDALTFRSVLECGAAEEAARRSLSEAERDHLTQRLEESQNVRLSDYRRMDSRLHLAIAEVTGARSLISAMADARMRLNELLDVIPLLKPNLEHSNAQHAQIIDAILAGDREAARALMAEHLSGTEALLRGFLT